MNIASDIPAVHVETVSGDLMPDVVARVKARARPRIAVDIETSGLDFRIDEIGSIQVFDGQSTVSIIRPPFSSLENLKGLFRDKEVLKIFHHAMFDLRFLRFKFGITSSNIACTKIAAKIAVSEDKNTSLRYLLNKYLGVEIDKSLQTSNWLSEVLSDDQIGYAIRDVYFLPKLLHVLTRDARQRKRGRLVIASFDYIPERVELDVQGIGDVFVY